MSAIKDALMRLGDIELVPTYTILALQIQVEFERTRDELDDQQWNALGEVVEASKKLNEAIAEAWRVLKLEGKRNKKKNKKRNTETLPHGTRVRIASVSNSPVGVITGVCANTEEYEVKFASHEYRLYPFSDVERATDADACAMGNHCIEEDDRIPNVQWCEECGAIRVNPDGGWSGWSLPRKERAR
jgi:hypothetical protein